MLIYKIIGGIIEINYDRIREIYGLSILKELLNKIDDVIANIRFFKKLGFKDTEDIFEREILLFLDGEQDFKNKVNKLIERLGTNYVEKIENDISLLEELL